MYGMNFFFFLYTIVSYTKQWSSTRASANCYICTRTERYLLCGTYGEDVRNTLYSTIYKYTIRLRIAIIIIIIIIISLSKE